MIGYDGADAWADMDDYYLVQPYVLGISREVNAIELAKAQNHHSASSFIMIDSGGYAHVCPPTFAQNFPLEKTGPVSGAKAANDASLAHFGINHVDGFLIDSDGKAHPTTVKFHVHNVRCPLFSTTKLKKTRLQHIVRCRLWRR